MLLLTVLLDKLSQSEINVHLQHVMSSSHCQVLKESRDIITGLLKQFDGLSGKVKYRWLEEICSIVHYGHHIISNEC